MKYIRQLTASFSLLLTASTLHAATTLDIKLGTLAFGTLNWELSALDQAQLQATRSIRITPHSLANSQAGKVALLSGSVDMIVSDWIWVSRQRAAGRDLTFVPYSTAAGALMVAKDSSIRLIRDLPGKKLGIAGGGLDKNWVLLRGLATQAYRMDLDSSVEKVFAAPPLLNQQLQDQRLDALINYWHYAARLEAKGYRRLLDGQGLLKQLGIQPEVPTLGYVFSASWAADKKHLLSQFFSATRDARDQLCQSDPTWQKIIPVTETDDPTTLSILRQRYCEGRVQSWSDPEKQAAEQVYTLLYQFGGPALVGQSEQLQAGTFWPYDITPVPQQP